MSQLPDARERLLAAERAATAGDLANADELLKDAARIQEAELGPLHPDLASTLNNLAIVAEKTGRLGDAEAFYRRAAAIAVESLPADDPAVQASRQNLEDFCRARNLPIDAAVLTTPPASDTQPTASEPSPPPRTASHAPAWIAIGAAVFVTGALLVAQPWSRGGPVPAPAAERPTPEADDSAAPLHTAPPTAPVMADETATAGATGPAERPTAMGESEPDAATNNPRASGPSTAAISLTAAELCRTFSTSGGRWRCDPAGDSVAPGAVVLYTRVRSRRGGAVEHRWYRGDTMRQTVRLSIRANLAQGYRTYSRQTVGRGTDWRVEVRSANGDVLHEQRFAVQ
jgi:hypothetical protein